MIELILLIVGLSVCLFALVGIIWPCPRHHEPTSSEIIQAIKQKGRKSRHDKKGGFLVGAKRYYACGTTADRDSGIYTRRCKALDKTA